MCGICGFIDYRKSSGLDILEEMTKTLNHRGPNDRGCNVFENDKFEVGFGQSRLSIIDLSMNGHQPMFYKNFSIVFNGEIYNYSEIKDELINLGHIFISNSDTEVILHSFEQWGELCVNRFIGMFSFSIFVSTPSLWNKSNVSLTLHCEKAENKYFPLSLNFSSS